MKTSASSILLPVLAAAGPTHAAATGPEIVAGHSMVMNAPVGEPTNFMPRGPLLGNGDVGVMQYGPAEQLIYHANQNLLWVELSNKGGQRNHRTEVSRHGACPPIPWNKQYE